MRRFDGDGASMADDTPGPEPQPGTGSWIVRVARVLILAALFAIPGVPAAFILMPMPRGADGITLCMPGIGPMQQFAEGMDPDLEEIVHIHERVHASQCRRMGALTYAQTYLDGEGMIALEAEAFCAEAATLAHRGRDTGPWVSRIIETLFFDYPHADDLVYSDVVRIVGAWCPPPDDRSAIVVHR